MLISNYLVHTILRLKMDSFVEGQIITNCYFAVILTISNFCLYTSRVACRLDACGLHPLAKNSLQFKLLKYASPQMPRNTLCHDAVSKWSWSSRNCFTSVLWACNIWNVKYFLWTLLQSVWVMSSLSWCPSYRVWSHSIWPTFLGVT